MRVAAITHVPFEGPAAIEDWASARGHHFETFRAYDPSAPHPGEFEMLVVMGGPMGVGDEDAHPWLSQEKRVIRAAIESGVFVLGVCLGAQLIADVLGAEVRQGQHTEIGWFPVSLTEAASVSSAFSHLPGEFDAVHWHGDTFDIPADAARMAASEATPNQAFELVGGRVIGLQFHLEETRESLELLIDAASHELVEGEPWIQSAEELLRRPERLAESRTMLYQLLDGMTLGR